MLLVADSLTFHGPQRPELATHPALWPNRVAAALDLKVDLVARIGWTARDAWWAFTRDPVVASVLLPRADVVVLGVGGMDQLPAWLPTYVRDGIAVIRPGWLRRRARAAFRAVDSPMTRLVDGRLRMLPQGATEAYLTRCVRGIRTFRPLVPILGFLPPPFHPAAFGGVTRTHAPSVAALRVWGERESVSMVDLDAVVTPYAEKGLLNVDGMHWGWEIHEAVAAQVIEVLRTLPPWCRGPGATPLGQT